jgi:hypothetical protein
MSGDPLREPVFIVGQARSGSSILYRLIQEHPSFRPADGLNLTESHLCDVLAAEPALGALSMRGFAALDDAGWADFERTVAPAERRRQLALRLPASVSRRALLRSVPLWSATGRASIARAYLEHAARSRGVERLVEKTPNQLPWSHHLLHIAPDARLVVICRHPLATYASFRRRSAEDAEAPWAALTPAAFADRWRYDVQLLGELATGGGGRLRVERYEQLVDDPDTFQRRLFGWLGEPPLAELPGTIEINPNTPASDSRQLFGTIGPTGHEWSTYVPEAEAAEVERALAAPMALLGYAPALT